jgi:hypothetical protein
MKTFFKFLSFVVIFILQLGWILPNLISSNDWILFTLGWFILLIVDPLIVFWYLKQIKLTN